MTKRPANGFTLIEVMVAMAILLIGGLGLVSMHLYGARMSGDGRSVTRATEIAEDLLAQMQTWNYQSDPRLANSVDANDADFADTAGKFQGAVDTAMYDHSEADLESVKLPATWQGIPTSEVTQLGFTRYWNIAEPDLDSNGAVTGKRVAAIVRWERNGIGRRVVIIGFLRDPGVTN